MKRGHKSLNTIVDEILTGHPNGLDLERLGKAARRHAGEETYAQRSWANWKRDIANCARAHDRSGLPRAAAINGRYVSRSHWGAAEYRNVMHTLLLNAQHSIRRAREYGDEYADRFGNEIDFAALINEVIDFDAIATEAVNDIKKKRAS